MNEFDFTGLKEKFSYCPNSGFLTNKKTGKVSGTKNKDGYLTVSYKRKNFYAHRVAWAITYGNFPDSMLDHINRNKADNRLCNLRQANASMNNQNKKFFGVTSPKQTKKFAAAITVNKKRKHLGYFFTKEDAHRAYVEAKKIYHPTAPENLFAV